MPVMKRLAIALLLSAPRGTLLGPTRTFYVYSAVMDTKVMEWYVHWAEVTGSGDVRYHQNTVIEEPAAKGRECTQQPAQPNPLHPRVGEEGADS